MKRTHISWMGLMMVMVLAGVVLWTACDEIPNRNDSASLSLIINLPGQDREGASPESSPEIKKIDPAAGKAAAAGGLVSSPPADLYHLKVMLTNPQETFMVYNYTPGTPVSLLVTAGTGRTLDVEAYLIPGATVQPETFPATHYYTVTPPTQRTLDLSGEPVSVTIDLAQNMSLSTLLGSTATPQYWDGNTLQPIPSDTCPPPSYYANVVDPAFGIAFPSIPVTLYSFSLGQWQLQIDNLPRNRTFFVEVWNMDSGLYDNLEVITANTVTSARGLLFNGYKPPSGSFSPHSLYGIDTYISYDWPVTFSGGLGGLSGFWGWLDTCSGFVSGGTYSMMVPERTVCQAHVEVNDCNGNWGDVFGLLYTTLPPTCNNNMTCEGALGEDNQSCPSDCYCGDGIFFPPYEDEFCSDAGT